MIVSYILSLSEPLSLPSTALLRIEIRDTSLADAPSVTLAETQQTAEQVSGKPSSMEQSTFKRAFPQKRR